MPHLRRETRRPAVDPSDNSRPAEQLLGVAKQNVVHRASRTRGVEAPSLFRLMGFRMGRTSVKQLLGESDRDYTYYRDRGWLSSDYFYPTRLGLLKKALGAGFDWLFARVYKRPATAQPTHDLRGRALTQ